MEEAKIIDIAGARKIIELDMRERLEGFAKALEALQKEFNCDLIPVTNIEGQSIDVSTFVKGQIAFRIKAN